MKDTSSLKSIPKLRRITLNALGTRFEVTEDLLRGFTYNSRLNELANHDKLTDAELTEICDDFDRNKLEFFFNRDPNVLKLILIYLINDELHMDLNMCPVHFAKELDYWRIDHALVLKCCAHQFENAFIEKVREIEQENELIKKCGEELWKKPTLKEWMWNILEHPKSSKPALVYFILTNLILFCWLLYFIYGTMPNVRQSIDDSLANKTISSITKNDASTYVGAFLIIDSTLFTYFLIDLLIRFFTCPDKLEFTKTSLNIIDAFSVFLFFLIFFCTKSFDNEVIYFIRRCIESLRVFLFLKFAKFSWRFRTIGKTLARSVMELFSGVFCVVVFMLIISTSLFYIEVRYNPQFDSIPAAFWWTVVTMTTVGYGDVVPLSAGGKFFASIAILMGVVLIAIPIGVVGSNFTLVYSEEERKRKLIKKYKNSASKFGWN